MNTYYVDIWGRENTIVLSIRGKKVYSADIVAPNMKAAKEIAWNEYKNSTIWSRRDFRIDCERAD